MCRHFLLIIKQNIAINSEWLAHTVQFHDIYIFKCIVRWAASSKKERKEEKRKEERKEEGKNRREER